jgi:hypothetical protein
MRAMWRRLSSRCRSRRFTRILRITDEQTTVGADDFVIVARLSRDQPRPCRNSGAGGARQACARARRSPSLARSVARAMGPHPSMPDRRRMSRDLAGPRARGRRAGREVPMHRAAAAASRAPVARRPAARLVQAAVASPEVAESRRPGGPRPGVGRQALLRPRAGSPLPVASPHRAAPTAARLARAVDPAAARLARAAPRAAEVRRRRGARAASAPPP